MSIIRSRLFRLNLLAIQTPMNREAIDVTQKIKTVSKLPINVFKKLLNNYYYNKFNSLLEKYTKIIK